MVGMNQVPRSRISKGRVWCWMKGVKPRVRGRRVVTLVMEGVMWVVKVGAWRLGKGGQIWEGD